MAWMIPASYQRHVLIYEHTAEGVATPTKLSQKARTELRWAEIGLIWRKILELKPCNGHNDYYERLRHWNQGNSGNFVAGLLNRLGRLQYVVHVDKGVFEGPRCNGSDVTWNLRESEGWITCCRVLSLSTVLFFDSSFRNWWTNTVDSYALQLPQQTSVLRRLKVVENCHFLRARFITRLDDTPDFSWRIYKTILDGKLLKKLHKQITSSVYHRFIAHEVA